MSVPGFQRSIGSSNIGLTFIRPMPSGGNSTSNYESEGSSVRTQGLAISDRLFPPRALEDANAAPPVSGVELGHFLIEERIGRGGMGAVFRAIDKRLGRVVAVKVLNVEHSSDPEAVLRFQNEARAAARLDHENIARVHYIGEEYGLHFIAFEFVMGENVRNLIQQRVIIAPADAVNYTLQIAEALRHTSAANVVHRDIKPSNIIISPSGRAKLVDLGLARHSNPDLSRDLTTVGTALGTFDYIAPEQALDARNVDVRSDIYSLGCTLYHMLTGTPPYPTGTMFEKVMNHHRPDPPNPAQKNRRISPQLARVVQKMMAANPDERYADPDDLIADLAAIAYSMGLQPTIPDAKVWQRATPGRDYARWNGLRTWTTVALLLVAVVLADRLRYTPAPGTAAQPGLNSPANLTLNKVEDVGREESFDLPSVLLGKDTPLTGSLALDHTPMGRTPQTVPMMPDDVFTPTEVLVPPPSEPKAGMTSATPGGTDVFTPVEGSGPVQPVNAGMSANPSLAGVETGVTTNGNTAPLTELGPSSPATSPPVMTVGPTLLSELGSQFDPAKPAPPEPVQTPPAMPQEFVAVRPATNTTPEERLSAPTLAAACSLAKDGWSVELPAGNSPIIVKDTLHISNKSIRLVPAKGYQPGIDARPLIRVDLSSLISMGPFVRTAQMLSIEHGAVELTGVDVELVVTPASNADWSIATLHQGSRLVARGSTFTIVNPGNSRATLVRVPIHEITEDAELMPERSTLRQNRVELTDSLCRGQFDFALQQGAPLTISMKNSALAISGCLVRIDGSETGISTGMERENINQSVITLEHVTALTGRGLLSANSGDHGSLPEIDVEMSGSICVVNSDEQIHQPFLEISGHESFEVLLDLLVFRNQRDLNYLQLSGPFVLIDFTKAQLPGAGRELTPDQISARHLQVVSEDLLELSRSMKLDDWHRVDSTELALSKSEDNPIYSVDDPTLPGVDWNTSQLPSGFPELTAAGK